MNQLQTVQPVEAKRVDDPQELISAISLALRECKDPYAQAYLQALPQATALFGQEGMGTQLLYCLNNMAAWRGETARQSKLIFRKWAQILTKQHGRGY